jgi:hypothetical protein
MESNSFPVLCNRTVTFSLSDKFLAKVLPTGTRLIPSLVRRGKPRSGGVVCSTSRSVLIDGREALLMNRCASRP